MRGHKVYVDIEWPDEDSKYASLVFRPDTLNGTDDDFSIEESFDNLINFVDRLKERLVEERDSYEQEILNEAVPTQE